MPTRADLMRHYPAAALKAGVAAEVRMNCGIAANGLLTACSPVQTLIKAPEGVAAGADMRAAFEKAAVAVSRYYQSRIAEPRPKPWPANVAAGLAIDFSPTSAPFLGPDETPPPPPPLPNPKDRRVESLTTADPKPVRIPASYAPPARKALISLAAEPAHRPVIVKPDWIDKPTGADVADFYPKAALATHTEGRSVIHCAVAATGKLTGCRISSEDPMGQGFGEASLALAAKFRMKPLTKDGVPTSGSEINIPIRYLLPTGAATSPPSAEALIAAPVWVKKPSAADMARLYPLEARKARFEVETSLTCQVSGDGRLATCNLGPVDILGDTPPTTPIATQFREAAVKLAPLFQMAPQAGDGRPVAGRTVRIPIRWTTPQGA